MYYTLTLDMFQTSCYISRLVILRLERYDMDVQIIASSLNRDGVFQQVEDLCRNMSNMNTDQKDA